MAVTMGQIGRRPWGCKTAHLFGAEWNPYSVLQILAASRMGSGLAVISAAQAGKTGADQVNWGDLGGHDREMKVGYRGRCSGHRVLVPYRLFSCFLQENNL